MQYIHYWHFNKNWYAKVNNNPTPERVHGHREDHYIYKCWAPYFIDGSTFLTHREIKKRLLEIHPECIPVKDIPFHEGRRWFGNKKGSR